MLPATIILQAGPDEDLAARIHAKLTQILVNPGLTAAGEHLVIVRPGFGIDPEVSDPDNAQDVLEAYSMLVDEVPGPYLDYVETGRNLSTVYGSLLDRMDVTILKNERDRNAARKARERLYPRNRPGTRSPQFNQYLTYQAAYFDKRDAAQFADAAATQGGGTPAETANLKAAAAKADAEAAAALNAWKNQGNKDAIEAILATLEKFHEEDLQAVVEEMCSDFATSAVSKSEGDGNYYPVVFSPDPTQWLDSAGWQTWSLNSKEAWNPDPALSLKPGSGNPGGQVQINLKLQTKRVSITRAWFNPGLFKSRAWRLPPDMGIDLVSSGRLEDAKPGIMPMVITGLLLAKNLEISAAESSQRLDPGAFKTLQRRSIKDKTVSVATKEASGMKITAMAPQILAFFCQEIPRSPNPDPTLFTKSTR
ncbi:hypothetical protein [Mesoterricola sediminis]|nr:hypothetical protein [Mesoterricola sediminis]